MAEPIAINTQGTTITFGGVVIGGVQSINRVASGQAKEVPDTRLSSGSIVTRPGLPDYGSLEIGVKRNQDDVGQVAMWNAYVAQTPSTSLIITLSGSTANVVTFNTWVMSCPFDINADDDVVGTFSLRIISVPLFT